MKLYLAVLMTLQIFELFSYIVLYRHMSNHNNNLLRSESISNDVYLVSNIFGI